MRRECPVGISRFGDAARDEGVIRCERMSKGAMGSCFESENNGALQFRPVARHLQALFAYRPGWIQAGFEFGSSPQVPGT